MRHIAILAASAALCMAITSNVYAVCDSRDDLVVDYTKIVNRKVDVGKVSAVARSLAGQGATVRVRVYDTLRGAPDMSEFADKIERECGWVSNGKRLSNMLFIPFAVEKGDITVRTGSTINARISEAMATKAITTYMVPRWQAYKHDPHALTAGLVDTLDSFRIALAQPLSGGGSTTIVRHEATDMSGLWSAFKWIAIGVIVIGFVVVGVFLYSRVSQDRGESTSAYVEVRRVRAGCLNRLLAITDPEKAVELEAMIDAAPKTQQTELLPLLNTFVEQGKAALAAFNRFDSTDKDDPNVKGLSPATYRSNEQAYEDIVAGSIEPAEESSRKISELLGAARKACVA